MFSVNSKAPPLANVVFSLQKARLFARPYFPGHSLWRNAGIERVVTTSQIEETPQGEGRRCADVEASHAAVLGMKKRATHWNRVKNAKRRIQKHSKLQVTAAGSWVPTQGSPGTAANNISQCRHTTLLALRYGEDWERSVRHVSMWLISGLLEATQRKTKGERGGSSSLFQRSMAAQPLKRSFLGPNATMYVLLKMCHTL